MQQGVQFKELNDDIDNLDDYVRPHSMEKLKGLTKCGSKNIVKKISYIRI